LTSRLLDLPEIERESILASRLEEMQKYKESLQLDAMFKMVADKDEDDDDDHPRKRQSECGLPLCWWIR
jgi:RNA polymerase-associated protein RTF1